MFLTTLFLLWASRAEILIAIFVHVFWFSRFIFFLRQKRAIYIYWVKGWTTRWDFPCCFYFFFHSHCWISLSLTTTLTAMTVITTWWECVEWAWCCLCAWVGKRNIEMNKKLLHWKRPLSLDSLTLLSCWW